MKHVIWLVLALGLSLGQPGCSSATSPAGGSARPASPPARATAADGPRDRAAAPSRPGPGRRTAQQPMDDLPGTAPPARPGAVTPASRPAAFVGGRLVAMVRPDGRREPTWAEPGDILPIGVGALPAGAVKYAIRYNGEPELRWSIRGKALVVNGAVRALVLKDLSPAAAAALVTKHRDTLEAVLDDGRAVLSPPVIAALGGLRTSHLVIQLHRLRGLAPRLPRLAKLGPKLYGLVLVAALVTDGDFRHLRALKGLRALLLVDTSISNAGLPHLLGLAHLQVLHLTWAELTDAGLARLSALRSLRRLRLQTAKASAAGFRHLAQLTGLRSLDLTRCTVNDAGVAALSALQGLRSLKLRRTRITDAGLAHVAKLRQLRHLDLEWTRITHRGLKQLRSLSQLRSLNLNTTRVDDAGLDAVSALRTLEHLNIGGARLTVLGFSPMKHLTRLRFLDLAPTNTTDSDLRFLAGMAGLETLNLRNTLLTGRGLGLLGKQRALQWVNLKETKVRPEAIRAFQRAHPGCVVHR